MAELRLDVLLAVERTGATVAEVCRRHGISRDTYYRYRRRYLDQGLEGLEDFRPPTSDCTRDLSCSKRATTSTHCQRRVADR
jgi:transposase-like protein